MRHYRSLVNIRLLSGINANLRRPFFEQLEERRCLAGEGFDYVGFCTGYSTIDGTIMR